MLIHNMKSRDPPSPELTTNRKSRVPLSPEISTMKGTLGGSSASPETNSVTDAADSVLVMKETVDSVQEKCI